MASLKVAVLPRAVVSYPPDHWVGSPPTHFRNPWPSAGHKLSLPQVLSTRFGSKRNFVPVPANREGLVGVQTPDWGAGRDGIKATWLGHSSFLIEMPPAKSETTKSRGLCFLMDPVFAHKMGPAGLVGPARFTPPPCSLEDLPPVDAICISHNHYDHLDVEVIKQLAGSGSHKYKARRDAAGMQSPVHIFCGLGSKAWFLGCGVGADQITEMDWWDEANIALGEGAKVKLACTPSQHNSRRGPFDQDQMLWCSFVLQSSSHAVFFGGDTGYRAVGEDNNTDDTDTDTDKKEKPPHCPAFAEIGRKYGPFALSLLPIGCYSPRSFMSGVHCSPEDAVEIHFDVKSQKSVGMHYGTVRGGISAYYEDVLEPPRRWRAAGEKRGLQWGKDFGTCNVGETVVVE